MHFEEMENFHEVKIHIIVEAKYSDDIFIKTEYAIAYTKHKSIDTLLKVKLL